MIQSIRHFLLISLLISMTIASSITAIGNYLVDKQVIQTYMDDQLVKLFTFITIISHATEDPYLEKKIATYLQKSPHINAQNFMFQVWSKEKKLINSSSVLPRNSMLNTPLGFSDIQIKNHDFRTYAQIDPLTQNKIIVAELYDIRNQLADDITHNNGYILLITYPIFGFLIWIIVGLALRSITRVTSEISNRASTYLEPVEEVESIPIEIKPLVIELNQLFLRLKLAFDRNKRFAGDAAHELRTPLAALKTQAQVALKANREDDRVKALQKVVQSVDRSSHVVAQLLTLSRLSQEEELNDLHPVDLHKLATEILAYLVPIALEKNIEIELAAPPHHVTVRGNDIALGILIRNIVDNAIRYTPENGSVKVQLLNQNQRIIFRVIDSGPGIAKELRDRVFERFYRVLGTQAQGSGLGLAIVSQIADLHHAKIKLNTPANGKGLQFDVEFVQL